MMIKQINGVALRYLPVNRTFTIFEPALTPRALAARTR